MTVWLDVRMNGCLLALLLPPTMLCCVVAVVLCLFVVGPDSRTGFVHLVGMGSRRASNKPSPLSALFIASLLLCSLLSRKSALSLFFYPKSKCFIFCSFVLFWSGSSIVPCCKRRHFSNKTSRAHSIHLLNPNPTTNNMRTGLEAQRTQMSELMERRKEKSRAKQKIMWQHNLQQFVIDFQLKIKRERERGREWEREQLLNCYYMANAK